MAVELNLIEQIREFETALIAEGLNALGCPFTERLYTGRDIKALTDIKEPLAGIVFTLTADSSSLGGKPEFSGFWEALDFISKSEVPVILAVKTIGNRPLHECIMGDGMAKMLKVAGGAGIITDGGVRDLEGINKTGYAVFASGVVAEHSAIRFQVCTEPITISGLELQSGDLLHGNEDGIVKIPQQYCSKLPEACAFSRDFETRVHMFWRRSDKTTEEKRAYAVQLAEKRANLCKSLIE